MMDQGYVLHFKRRRQGKTDYRKRLVMVRSGANRFSVRITNSRVIAQITSYDKAGDKTLVSVDSKDLSGLGWKHSATSTPAAYLTGMLCARKGKKAKAGKCVLDIGRKTPTTGGRIFAALKGAVDGGLEMPHSEDRIPDEKRIRGEHIKAYRKADVPSDFDKVKAKILKE